MRLFIGLVLAGLGWSVAASGKESPLSLDRTGLQWALPFQEALAKAKRENRLLLIKPVAFGTDAAGGW